MLIAKDDAYILDFEGEPRRPLEERRAKAPAARDVAGFIRSIDYAAAAAVDREPDLKPEERAAVEQRLRAWAERLSAAFWESYRETLGDSPLWPADEDADEGAARSLPARKSALRDRIRAHQPARLVAYPLGSDLAHPRTAGGDRPMSRTRPGRPRDHRRPPCRSVQLSRSAHRERHNRAARFPAGRQRVIAVGDRRASANYSASIQPDYSPARSTIPSTTGCVPASATTRSSWKTPTASRRFCPISTCISSAKAITCASTTSSAPIP